MTREEKEVKKKAGQALLIAEFPQICRNLLDSQIGNHTNTEYNPFGYNILVKKSHAAIISKLNRWDSPPKIQRWWKEGLEVELKKAWDAELVKIKEDALKIVREKIPHVCKVKVNLLCTDVIYPTLTEDTFNSVVSLTSSSGRLPRFQDSWKEDIREDVTEAWNAEVEKAKSDGRIPTILDDAFKIAWAYLERTKPFEHHKWISWIGLKHVLTNLVMGYPKSPLWIGVRTDNNSDWDPSVYIPVEIKDDLWALYVEINARGAKS